MCHIIQCVTLGLDLIQRLITYFFACFIFFVVYIALTAALIAGMTYGYKYYFAEYYTINSTLHEIRKLSLEPKRSVLSEFDTKNYKDLMEYYEFQLTSTETTTTTKKKLLRDFTPDGQPQLVEGKLVTDDRDDEMDRATLDSKEDLKRVTFAFDYSDTPDVTEYVKKINWLESNRDLVTDAEEPIIKLDFSVTNEDSATVDEEVITRQPVMRPMEPTKKIILSNKSSTKRPSEYSDDRSRFRYLKPIHIIAATSSTKKGSGIKYYIDKLKSELAHDIIRRGTEEPKIFNTTNATSTSDSKVLSILLKHLTAIPTEATTAAVMFNKTSSKEVSSDNSSTPPIKEYERRLNLALSQRVDKTRDEKIVIV